MAEIPVDVMPMPRPRAGLRHVYIPRELVACKKSIALLATAQMPRPLPPLPLGEIEVELEIHSTRKQGDIDNYAKTVLDALNGVVWRDDRQIRKLGCELHLGSPIPILRVRAQLRNRGGRHGRA